MATKKITELTELSVSPASNDVVAIVDIDADVTKKITINTLQAGLLSGSGQISTEISGAFTAPSASFSTRVTTLESGGGTPTFIGSGSTSASADPNNGVVVNASGSTLFDVRGSLGSLFSVTDSFDGNLFEVNNISGISLLSVSSSGDVDIPKGKLTVSSSVSASQFLGDGSQLTNLPASDAFPFTGDAQITGSLIVSGAAEFRGVEDFDTNVVIGKDATSTGQYSVVIGKDAGISSGGSENVVIGHSANLANNTLYNVVIGEGAYGNGAGSVAIGEGATAAGEGVAIGRGANVSDYRGIAIGKGITSGLDQLSIGNSANGTLISGSLATGHIILSGSTGGLELIGSGSTVFEVIGSEGTLFAVDDDLDGVIFTANDRTGLPVLQAEADGEVYLGKTPQSLYTTAVVSATSASSTASLIALSTSSYDSAYFDFTCTSASNSTVGSIMSTWNGATIAFNEHATSSIGTTYRTAGLDLQVIISASQAQLVAITDSTSPNTWKVKTTVRAI